MSTADTLERRITSFLQRWFGLPRSFLRSTVRQEKQTPGSFQQPWGKIQSLPHKRGTRPGMGDVSRKEIDTWTTMTWMIENIHRHLSTDFFLLAKLARSMLVTFGLLTLLICKGLFSLLAITPVWKQLLLFYSVKEFVCCHWPKWCFCVFLLSEYICKSSSSGNTPASQLSRQAHRKSSISQ